MRIPLPASHSLSRSAVHLCARHPLYTSCAPLVLFAFRTKATHRSSFGFNSNLSHINRRMYIIYKNVLLDLLLLLLYFCFVSANNCSSFLNSIKARSPVKSSVSPSINMCIYMYIHSSVKKALHCNQPQS